MGERVDSGPPTERGPDVTRTHEASGTTQTATPHGGVLGDVLGDARPASGSGRFRDLRRLDQGNLGVVYVARDGELNRDVALKEIRDDRAQRPDSRAAFVLEAEIAGGLEHPNIVPIYSLGFHDDGRPYYAMRLIRGETLRDAIRRFHQADNSPTRDPDARNLELRGLLRRFVDVCNALAYAHSRRVVHRDIKPANIMLGPYGQTMLVDWGLAKPHARVDEDEPSAEAPLEPYSHVEPTLMGTFKGTPQYMSPEQAEAEPATTASDIYSLGATLYCLIVGTNPFPGGGDHATVLAKVRRGAFVPPREANRRVPAPLEAACLKAMALRPANRYPNAQALADDIDRWLADEPVTAHDEPWGARVARWERKHRTLIRVAGAALLAIATISTTTAVLINHARGEMNAARIQAERNEKDAQRSALAAREARGQVEDRMRQLRDLVDRFLDPSVDVVHMVPDVESLRLEMADTNVRLYHAFLKAETDNPELPPQAARVFRRAANIHRLLGQDAPAGTLYDEALALVASTPPPPDDPDSLPMLKVALLRDRAAWHAFNGRLRAALVDLDAAVETLQGMDPPRDDRAKQSRNFNEGVARLDRASTLLQMGRTVEALDDAERSIERLGPIAAAKGARPIEIYLFVMAQNALGSTLHELGRDERAMAVLDGAERNARALYRSRSLDPNVFHILGGVLDTRAELLADAGRLSDARKAAGAGTSGAYFFRATLFNLHRDIPHYRRAVIDAKNLAARIDLELGMLDDAERLANEVLAALDAEDERAPRPSRLPPGAGRGADGPRPRGPSSRSAGGGAAVARPGHRHLPAEPDPRPRPLVRPPRPPRTDPGARDRLRRRGGEDVPVAVGPLSRGDRSGVVEPDARPTSAPECPKDA